MKPEAKKAQDKPVLSAKSFQRLLAAAYILQLHNDSRPSVQPIGAGHVNPFKAGAIVQKRTPSVLLREPRLRTGQPDPVPLRSPNHADKSAGRRDQSRVPKFPEVAPIETTEVFIAEEIAKEHVHPSRLVPPVEPTVPRRTEMLLRGPMYWRTAEALAIATVFSMMLGASIHRFSSLSDRASLPSGMLEQPSASQPARPAARALASSQQPVGTRNSCQLPNDGEADVVAADFVIRYRESAVNLPSPAAKKATGSPAQAPVLAPRIMTSKPGVRLAFGRDADMFAAATVVQYGADVTVWSGNSKRARLDRSRH